MAEKWFVGNSRPDLLGATVWYGAYRTEAEAQESKAAVEGYWFQRSNINGPYGYTFIERDDAADDVDYGQLTLEQHRRTVK